MADIHSGIISNLKDSGQRITKVRTQIVELFTKSNLPLSAQEILEDLETRGLKVNKTTVYREIDFLTAQKIIKDLDFGDGKKRFELYDDSKHHHHIICLNCKAIEDVDLKLDLQDEENRISKQKNFQVLNHSLEFFGLCSNCKNQ